MGTERRVIEFQRSEIGEVVAALAEIAASGKGWVNIEPILDDDTLDTLRRESPPALIRLFSGRGPKIPFATFVPGGKGKPGQVGLEHPSGPRTVRTLREAGVNPPAGWRMRQDHGKRGIVFDVPAGSDPVEMLHWMLDSASYVAGVDLTGWWSAAINRPT